MINWFKYLAIRAKSTITNKTVVEMFGKTYIVYGNAVKKVGEHSDRLN